MLLGKFLIDYAGTANQSFHSWIITASLLLQFIFIRLSCCVIILGSASLVDKFDKIFPSKQLKFTLDHG